MQENSNKFVNIFCKKEKVHLYFGFKVNVKKRKQETHLCQI